MRNHIFKKVVELFLILFIIFSCKAPDSNNEKPDTMPKQLLDTNVKWTDCDIIVNGALSEPRRQEFINKKLPILNPIAGNLSNQMYKEIDAVVFKDLRNFRDMLDKILKAGDLSNPPDGMRIYIGTRRGAVEEEDDEESDDDDTQNAGRLKLIFTPTKKEGKYSKDYNANFYFVKVPNTKEYKKVCRCRAKKWVQNYQDSKITLKRKNLNATLPSLGLKETKHIFFKTCKVKSLIDNIDGKIKNGDTTLGVKIRLVAYTDSTYWPKNRRKRLTIDFVYVDSFGVEISSNEYDSQMLRSALITLFPYKKDTIYNIFNISLNKSFTLENISKILNPAEMGVLYNAMDTGDPTPPERTRLEALDIAPD